MTIAQELESLRQAVPGCQIAAYADLGSRLVLSVSAPKRPQQEELDALSERAALLLDGPALGAALPDEAIDMTPDRTTACLRSRAEPNEVLCCVGSSGMDVAVLMDAARAALARMTSRD